MKAGKEAISSFACPAATVAGPIRRWMSLSGVCTVLYSHPDSRPQNKQNRVEYRWTLRKKGNSLACHLVRYATGRPPTSAASSALRMATLASSGAIQNTESGATAIV